MVEVTVTEMLTWFLTPIYNLFAGGSPLCLNSSSNSELPSPIAHSIFEECTS